MFLVKLIAQATPPFPNGAPAPGSTVTTFGDIVGTDALQKAADAGNAAASGADHLWQEWVSPNSPFYQALIKATLPLAALGFAIWATMWARDLIHDHRNPLHWQKVVWPLLVIMLFYNNGTLLANSTLAAKSLTYAVANSILNDTSSGIEAKRQIQMTLFKDSFSSYAAAQKQACVGITNQDEHDQCISNAEAKAAELAKKAQGLTPGLPNGSFPLDLLGALKGVFATGIVEILQASAAAFHYLAALVLAIWAATGPFWVSLTLLPISTKGINFFISGFFGISVLIITEDMLNAATAISLAQAPDTDPLFVPLLMGLLNPFLAVIIGSGGAIGIFVGISKGINWLTGKFI